MTLLLLNTQFSYKDSYKVCIPSDFPESNKEMCEWIQEKMGYRGMDWEYEWESSNSAFWCKSQDSAGTDIFFFKSANDALLFKLKFSGK